MNDASAYYRCGHVVEISEVRFVSISFLPSVLRALHTIPLETLLSSNLNLVSKVVLILISLIFPLWWILPPQTKIGIYMRNRNFLIFPPIPSILFKSVRKRAIKNFENIFVSEFEYTTRWLESDAVIMSGALLTQTGEFLFDAYNFTYQLMTQSSVSQPPKLL